MFLAWFAPKEMPVVKSNAKPQFFQSWQIAKYMTM